MPHNFANAAALPQNNWRARQDKARARIERARDPLTHAVARVRAATRDVADAEGVARQEWKEQNSLVACPLPALVHPEVAALLIRLMHENGLLGRDLAAPLETNGVTLESLVAKRRDAAQAALDAAQRELVELEAQRAQYDALLARGPYGGVDAPLKTDAPDDEAEPARRGRGRPSRTLAEKVGGE